jgi:hypothetical protein
MSIKTTKRIALGVIASLVFAPFAALAPAGAAATIGATDVDIAAYGVQPTATDTFGLCNVYSADATKLWGLTTSSVVLTIGDVADAAGDAVLVSVAGNAVITTFTAGTSTADVLSGNQKSFSTTADNGADVFATDVRIIASNAVAGDVITITVSEKEDGAATATLETITLNIVAACASTTMSLADTLFSYQDAADQAITTLTDDTGATAIANGGTGYIPVVVNNAYGEELNAGTLSAEATNGAVVGIDAAPVQTSVVAGTYASAGVIDIHVAQGTANANKPLTTVVTIKYNGTTIGTKTLGFLGDAATVTVSGVDTAEAGGARTGVFDFVVLDSAGNQLAGYLPVVETASLTANSGVTTITFAGNSSATAVQTGGWTCAAASTTAITDDIRIQLTNTAGTVLFSNVFTARCASLTEDTFTATLDKSSYVPGDIATLTITAKDASGTLVPKTAVLQGIDVTGSQLSPVIAPNVADTYTTEGTRAYKFVVGTTPGTYAAIVKLTSTVTGAVTVPYTVALPVVPVVVPPVAPKLSGELTDRVLLFGSCEPDEGDLIVYVKSPGKLWQERAKTFECAAGEFDGSIRAPKSTKFYRVKQEGTGLWSSSILIRR